jgi:hypothetical protein
MLPEESAPLPSLPPSPPSPPPAGGPALPAPAAENAADAAGNAPPPVAPNAAAGAAEQPPGLTLASLAAALAGVTSLVQQLVQTQAAATAAAQSDRQAAAAPAPAPAPAPSAPPPVAPAAVPILPFVPLPQSPASSIPPLVSPPRPPPPHRAAVLDRAAVASQSDIAALVNRFSALRDDSDSDNEDTTVPPQPHTHTARSSPPAAAGILPQAFIPPPVGTESSATQQLAAIFSALNKQGGKVKYSSIEELDEALDDWATDALRSGRTAPQVETIRAYQRLLTKQFFISDRMPLKQVLEYHRLWCKEVHAGTIDMGTAMDHDIYYKVTHPLRLSAHGSAASSSQTKDGKFKAAADKTKKPTVKHPAGSCTHHPTSTSHTTAGCIKKGGQ